MAAKRSRKGKKKAPKYSYPEFFKELGRRLRALREERGYTQEDMINFDFSARHWQGMEHGRPMTATTLVRVCIAFAITIESLVTGLPVPKKMRPDSE